MSMEEEDRNGEIVTVYSVRISQYLQPATTRGLGIIGQPQPQYYFHRPLNVLLGACFTAGFVLDGLEEPAFSEPARPSARPLSWNNYTSIPPVLVARARLAAV